MSTTMPNIRRLHNRFWRVMDELEAALGSDSPEFLMAYDHALKAHDAGKTTQAIAYLTRLIDEHKENTDEGY